MDTAIEFDKPRSLRFDLAAIKDLEAAMGGKPLGGIVNDLSQMSVTALVNALWAGLKHEDKSLTPNLVTKMLERYCGQKKSVKTLINAVSAAIEDSGLFKSVEAEEEAAVEGNGAPEPAAAR